MFNELREAGCDSEDLAGLLFAVFTIAVAHSRGNRVPNDISIREARRLAGDLRSLADRVEGVNKTAQNPKFDLLAAPPDRIRDPARKHVARLYDKLPEIMRAYSYHLEPYSKLAGRSAKESL